MSSNPAFLVDGKLEQKFFQNICPKAPVRYINCNGKEVKISVIAPRIASLIRALGGKYYPIFIIIDREERTQSAKEIKKDLISEIKKHNISETFYVGIADREIENWILQDENVFQEYPDYKKLPRLFEGSKGKSTLKKIIPDYHETTMGVELLCKCRPKGLMQSESFKDFFDEIKPHLECWWLETK
jgi:hypothetical protein